ncbi:MAG: metallophosphoesterase family protein, partial [Ardenticatenaceae bacterium]
LSPCHLVTYTPPMKLGLLSDTHGWLDPALHEWFRDVEMILHAGDVGREAVLEELRGIAPTVAVRGNVDGGAWARELPLQTVATIGGSKIALLHIGGTPKKPGLEARALIKREQPDILLVGHSHIAVVERRQGVLWINPGAAGRQGLHSERTAMLLHLGAKQHIDVITLGPRGRSWS